MQTVIFEGVYKGSEQYMEDQTRDKEKDNEKEKDKEKDKDQDKGKDNKEQGIDIEALLAEGKSIRIHPQGYSMYPLFVPGRDEAVIAPAETEELKRGDVVLYRREGSILVLHRIWKRRAEGFYMVGDNQSEVEGPLKGEQIKGILCQVVRRGKCFSVRNPIYRMLAAVWLRLRPFRPFLSRMVAGVKRTLKNVCSKNGKSGDKSLQR